jgi:hypothetical protein
MAFIGEAEKTSHCFDEDKHTAALRLSFKPVEQNSNQSRPRTTSYGWSRDSDPYIILNFCNLGTDVFGAAGTGQGLDQV